MTSPGDRVERIQSALRNALEPLHLRVEDESAQHAGHAGAADGRGHFRVHIVSQQFCELSRLKRHRLVYAALEDEFADAIHALAIHAFAPEEWDESRAGD